MPLHEFLCRSAAGSETPSRTSWSHFFVRESAKHALIAAAEAQIEALFGCSAVRGPQRPLAKVEALQGEERKKRKERNAKLCDAAWLSTAVSSTELYSSCFFPPRITSCELVPG